MPHDFVGQLEVRDRRNHSIIDAASQNGDGFTPSCERPSVSDRIDAEGHTGDDDDASTDQILCQFFCYLHSIGGMFA